MIAKTRKEPRSWLRENMGVPPCGARVGQGRCELSGHRVPIQLDCPGSRKLSGRRVVAVAIGPVGAALPVKPSVTRPLRQIVLTGAAMMPEIAVRSRQVKGNPLRWSFFSPLHLQNFEPNPLGVCRSIQRRAAVSKT